MTYTNFLFHMSNSSGPWTLIIILINKYDFLMISAEHANCFIGVKQHTAWLHDTRSFSHMAAYLLGFTYVIVTFHFANNLYVKTTHAQ